MNQITMLMYCTDQKGIIAAVTNFIHQNQGNITYIDQYVDRPNAAFFMRIECDLNAIDLDQAVKIISGSARSMGIEVKE